MNPFVKVFEREENIALFNGLTLQTAYMTQNEFAKLEINSENNAELITHQFLVLDYFDSEEYLNHFKSIHPLDSSIRIAYFLLTDACNFRCKYCFIKTRMLNENGEKMSIETARKGIDLIARNTQNVKIIFYGGEPLLNKDVLKFSVLYAREKIKEVRFSMITNGALIDDEMAEFIKKNEINVGVSLDGPSKINDQMRVTNGNTGTYHLIQRGISLLKEKEIPFGLSVTLGPHNIDQAESVVDEVIKANPSGVGQNLLTTNDGVSAENNLIIETALNNEEKLRNNHILDDRVFNRKIKPFLEERPRFKDCGAYGNQVVITPNGQLGTCHGLWPDNENKKQLSEYFPLTVDYNRKLNDHPYWKEWAGRIPHAMKECRSCYGISLCGGGCAKNSIIHSGSMWHPDKTICEFTRTTIERMVWDYFDKKYDSLDLTPSSMKGGKIS
jgi:uncharacterized protein